MLFETSAYHTSRRGALTLGKPLSIKGLVSCSEASQSGLPIYEKYVVMWSHAFCYACELVFWRIWDCSRSSTIQGEQVNFVEVAGGQVVGIFVR